MPKFKCSRCEQRYEWTEKIAGKRVKCKCGNTLVVPNATAPSPPKPPAEDPSLDALADLENNDDTYELNTFEPQKPQPPKKTSPKATGAKKWAKAATDAIDPDNDEIKSRQQQVLQFWLFTLALILGGGGMIGFASMNADSHKAFVAVAKEASATITAEPTIRHGGKKLQKLNPENWYFDTPVEFEVEGQTHQAEVEILGKALPDELSFADGGSENAYKIWIGKSIPILYDPANPKTAKTVATAEGKNWTMAYFVGGGCVAVGLFFLVTKWPYGRNAMP